MEIVARNVNDAYCKGLTLLYDLGIQEQSRNGRVVVLPEPLTTVYTHPRERVLFSPERNANPFFHLMEALWMMNGQRDAEWPKYFNSNMATYENAQGNFDGAYGYRWRQHFGYDQLTSIIPLLKHDPSTRRAVLAMHDARCDLNTDTKDQPCNTHIYFSTRSGTLNMTVCCRSNDAIWGAYGANAVHMSVLMEVVASMAGFEVGEYRQFSNNFHYYPDVPGHQALIENAGSDDVRTRYGWPVMPLVKEPLTWFGELYQFMKNPANPRLTGNPFFYHVARPMYLSWAERKDKLGNGRGWAEQIEDPSWQYACLQWIDSKEKK